MITLGVETSAARGGVALWKQGEKPVEVMMNGRLKHAEELLPLTACLFDRCGVRQEEIELVSVNQGPGSFTGLRIGLATAKGFCQSLQIPLVGVDGTIAYRSRLDAQARVCVILPNRRDLFYARWFVGMKTQGSVEVMTHTQVQHRFAAQERPTWVIGGGVATLRDELSRFPWVKLAPSELNDPSPGWIARLGKERYDRDQLYDLEPAYVEPILFRKAG